jgi:eukaryotic-like serine/threonine-protein kinase
MFTGDLSDANLKIREALATERETGREDFVVADLTNLGRVLYLQGNLDESEKMLNESLAICLRINDKQDVGEVLGNLGDLLKAKGSLDRAKADYQQALKISNETGNKTGVAGSQISIAVLSIEQGHAGNAVLAIREAREALRKQGDMDNELRADAALAQALLAQGKSAEAAKEIDTVTAEKLQDEEVRLELELATAFVRAASGKRADQSAAIKALGATLGEATKHGFVGYELEARLALGEIDIDSSRIAVGRSDLQALERDAKAKGFLLIASKAAAAARRSA